MRKVSAISAAIYVALGALSASLAEESFVRPMKRGEILIFLKAENPSTGYSWRIDLRASAGLDRLAVSDEGYKPGGSLPGAPGTHSWTIRALKPGRATIRFVYQRPWEPTPVKTLRVTLAISP